MPRAAHFSSIIAAVLFFAVALAPIGPRLHAEGARGEAEHHLDSLLGREVTTRPDALEGRIVDILVDQSGKIRAAVVEFGGFLGIGTRKIAVDWGALRLENGGIVADVSRDQLRAAKEYKPGAATLPVQSIQY
ncbi:MAG: PRC-barrel domain containing protein [Hyphomicrobiales bacterium]|nr:MAG: PRC-barrel domain containing protein [Hyphomicrobiales bacterium]